MINLDPEFQKKVEEIAKKNREAGTWAEKPPPEMGFDAGIEVGGASNKPMPKDESDDSSGD